MTGRDRHANGAKRRQATTGSNGPGASPVDDIYERIVSAIFEHRLQPGTKLGEDRMAAIFGVSRSRIRLVLMRLAHEQIVRLEPNRGAFVAAPTPDEARDIFEARRLIEPGIVRRLIDTLPANGLGKLRALVRDEGKARERGDRRAIIRLSGEFHVLLAELAGNQVLTRTMRELASLTCLIIFLYDSPSIPSCHGDEHADIIEAIAAGDSARAVRLMSHHLDHVEQTLALNLVKAQPAELEQVFGD